MMIDNHVHIGWFSDGYHSPVQVWSSLRDAGIDEIAVSSTSTCAKKCNLANRLSIDETEQVIQDIIDYDRDYLEETLKLELYSSLPEEEFAEMPLCGAGINSLCITVNGDVYPCAGWQAFIVGNVFKQSLKDIWVNSPKLAIIRKVKRKDFPKCLTCEARDYCAMCLVRNYNESDGDMFKVNQHFCDVAFLNKRLVEEWKSKQQ